MSILGLTPEQRFWPKVDKTGDCWIWLGATRSNGYGNFWSGTATTPAHRFAYILLRGPIPTGLDLDHLCRVRNCVNPDHLEPVTRRENTLRGQAPNAVRYRETLATGMCPKGHPAERIRFVPFGPLKCRECHQEWMRAKLERDPEYREARNARERELRRARKANR